MSTDRSLLTKALHGLLAVAVIHQLVIINFMIAPKPGRPENFAFELHEWVGLTSLGLLLAYWLWTLVRRGEVRFSLLVPWFSPKATLAVWQDFRLHLSVWRRGRLPDVGSHPFAHAVHGLGLIVMSVMAVTGTMSLISVLPEPVRTAGMTVHEASSKLVWAYVIGHASLAILHEVAGHRLFRQMFWSH
ncbi:MAG: hypothetical protein A2792_09360 [Sphingomonadales bacterium RIFCSPHIGHO2_01_FULL_65_20]|jgi:cytochrome b561|nr:MAG: hypothetical protein A2792_09360 [Sphingomonadales bacterium RIFCSPHIGHO2_01_FULL_65_20]